MKITIDVFRHRCEARALLWQVGELDYHDAIDALQELAEDSGLLGEISQDAIQLMIAQAFEPVIDREPPLPELNDPTPRNVAQSTLDAAAWLWFQKGDEPQRFRDFVKRHSPSDRAAIVQHIEHIKAKRHAGNER